MRGGNGRDHRAHKWRGGVAGDAGVHRIELRATDAAGTVAKNSFYSVRVDGDTTAPLTLTGTAFDAILAYYQLLLRPSGEGAWR